jgi:hypothetical protein
MMRTEREMYRKCDEGEESPLDGDGRKPGKETFSMVGSGKKRPGVRVSAIKRRAHQ